MIEITELKEATQRAADELVMLGRALHSDERTMTLVELEELVQDDTAILMVVKDDAHIVGMATLYIIPKVGRRNSLLEDVIVDAAYRGQGLGEKLVRAVIEAGKTRGVTSITLISRPERVVAHKLYEKLDFKVKETDVFKLDLGML
jgi:ribosomal protein S18 acetylase RimI-like enzyme